MKAHYDLIEVLIAGAVGFGTMMTHLDLVFKVLIGVASLTYIIIKIIKEIKR